MPEATSYEALRAAAPHLTLHLEASAQGQGFKGKLLKTLQVSETTYSSVYVCICFYLFYLSLFVLICLYASLFAFYLSAFVFICRYLCLFVLNLSLFAWILSLFVFSCRFCRTNPVDLNPVVLFRCNRSMTKSTLRGCVQNSCLSSSRCCCCKERSWAAILSCSGFWAKGRYP